MSRFADDTLFSGCFTDSRFNDPSEAAADIARLRQLHVEMDHAVAAAYGWSDLDLGHGFHTTAQGVRYTISEPARRQVLGQLLELNHARYAAPIQCASAQLAVADPGFQPAERSAVVCYNAFSAVRT